MTSDTHSRWSGRGGGGRPLIRLLGIGALAALAALLWTVAGASAQVEKARATVEYRGWAAADTLDAEARTQISTSQLIISRVADNSSSAQHGQAWTCPNLRCHYLHVSWSGLAPIPATDDQPEGYNIHLVRRRAPSPEDIGVSGADFASTTVPIQLSLYRVPADASERYVPVPWPGERVSVMVTGRNPRGTKTRIAFDSAEIPQTVLPASFAADKAPLADAQFGATLVENHLEGDLPTVVTVWRKADKATHYEVQYTLRTRSRVSEQRRTKWTSLVGVGQISDATQGADQAYQYSALNAGWAQHPNAAVLSGLQDSDFGDPNNEGQGQWMGALATLPALLAGQEHWPESTPGAVNATAITRALRVGKNALGLRVRPVLACAAHASDLCSDNSQLTGARALRGKQSRIVYVQFKGRDADSWILSASTP